VAPSPQRSGSDARTTPGRLTPPPAVRFAPRDDLAALARVAPLLRAARDLEQWRARQGGSGKDVLTAVDAADAAAALDLAPREIGAAWRAARAIRAAEAAGDARSDQPAATAADTAGGQAAGIASAAGLIEVLAAGTSDAVLRAWEAALAAFLDAEELDGIATALYTAGGPVEMDGLFDAFAAASGNTAAAADRKPASRARRQVDPGAALSLALETLADLGVVEIGMREDDGGLTVALSPLGAWGVHRRLGAQGWHVPVAGAATNNAAAGELLMALAGCDAEAGEAEITRWLATRDSEAAAAELIDAAADGSPGQRGAAFAVLDRIGPPALGHVRDALGRPLLRAHAAVWLAEHGEDVRIEPDDRTWLLVDLGAGLLEEARPQDVVADLLPDVPAAEQAEIVAELWRVRHPGVTGLLTALSDHHPEPGVARAARKAAFKARSPAPAGP
jgi:hypothetical protein